MVGRGGFMPPQIELMPDFRRKPIRLKPSVYIGQHWYFITVCTFKRQPLFRDATLVLIALEELRRACVRHSFDVYAYCFMPDHVHLELVARTAHSELAELMRDFKGRCTPLARRLGIPILWQKGYFDYVLRPGEREKSAAWYILMNPVRKNLVPDPRDWPYSGSWIFDWKKAVAPPNNYVPPWKAKKVAGLTRRYNRPTTPTLAG
jgi:REP-associated tyrosine transposase